TKRRTNRSVSPAGRMVSPMGIPAWRVKATASLGRLAPPTHHGTDQIGKENRKMRETPRRARPRVAGCEGAWMVGQTPRRETVSGEAGWTFGGGMPTITPTGRRPRGRSPWAARDCGLVERPRTATGPVCLIHPPMTTIPATEAGRLAEILRDARRRVD